MSALLERPSVRKFSNPSEEGFKEFLKRKNQSVGLHPEDFCKKYNPETQHNEFMEFLRGWERGEMWYVEGLTRIFKRKLSELTIKFNIKVPEDEPFVINDEHGLVWEFFIEN